MALLFTHPPPPLQRRLQLHLFLASIVSVCNPISNSSFVVRGHFYGSVWKSATRLQAPRFGCRIREPRALGVHSPRQEPSRERGGSSSSSSRARRSEGWPQPCRPSCNIEQRGWGRVVRRRETPPHTLSAALPSPQHGTHQTALHDAKSPYFPLGRSICSFLTAALITVLPAILNGRRSREITRD